MLALLGAGGKHDIRLSGSCWDHPHPKSMGSSAS